MIMCHNYRISDTFDGDFNLADLSLIAKLKSPPILFLDGTVEVSCGNAWPIRQTKCSPICVCCLIAKLNVRQMYHLYGICDNYIAMCCCYLNDK